MRDVAAKRGSRLGVRFFVVVVRPGWWLGAVLTAAACSEQRTPAAIAPPQPSLAPNAAPSAPPNAVQRA
ncbi:MAG TPA: hypothetical protein VKU41_18690, partial [Polyangiaceae bacterium]|nr:hypothetical protein [Polyangiaceae bacterium]